jgi:hypothetical protein
MNLIIVTGSRCINHFTRLWPVSCEREFSFKGKSHSLSSQAARFFSFAKGEKTLLQRNPAQRDFSSLQGKVSFTRQQSSAVFHLCKRDFSPFAKESRLHYTGQCFRRINLRSAAPANKIASRRKLRLGPARPEDSRLRLTQHSMLRYIGMHIVFFRT